MKRKGKIWFFVVAIVIVFLAVTTVTGVTARYADTVVPIIKSAADIRFGIDIRGGVDVSFTPAGEVDATDTQMEAAQAVIEQRLMTLGITDYELYKDLDNDRVIVRFPWKEDETEFDPQAAIQELAATAILTFREGAETDEATGAPTGVTAETIILQGDDVTSASAEYGQVNATGGSENYVSLNLSAAGAEKFSEGTKRIAEDPEGGVISIWMDDTMISAPSVQSQITGGKAVITGNFDAESAKALADKINAGSLPFALEADNFSTISPTLGSQSLKAMTIAGIVALLLVSVFMIANYRLPGVVASIAIFGQSLMTLALISGYFAVFNSFTLTLPGIAGIVLGIGIGVDANVIQCERIREELRGGKKLDSALRAGFQRGFAPIIDGNITVLIVAVILMGAFGPTDSFFARVLRPIFFAFGEATAGTIYSFGYTLLIGVAMNLIFGVFCTRVMLTSLSKFNKLRKPTYYGGLKEGQTAPPAPSYNVVGNHKRFFTLSSLLIVAIIVCTLVLGVSMDVQFKGGAILTYGYTGELATEAVEESLNEVLDDEFTLQTGTTSVGSQTLTITLAGGETIDAAELEAITNKLNEDYPDAAVEQMEVNNVNPVVGREFLLKCVVALVAASLLILIYIAFRFRKIGGWMGGLTAIVALLHDLIIVYGVFVVLGIPLSGNFIAALLTILGYSINDTVIIYDRVRENRGLYGKKLEFGKLVNKSINQSLKRSVYTTTTTLAALGCVCIFALVYGLTSIFTFVFPLMIGMVSGVYSSICIAGPLWVMMVNRKNKGNKKIAAGSDSKKDVKIVTADEDSEVVTKDTGKAVRITDENDEAESEDAEEAVEEDETANEEGFWQKDDEFWDTDEKDEGEGQGDDAGDEEGGAKDKPEPAPAT